MSKKSKEYLLEMNDITVRFPGVLALDKVHFDMYPGEVHALLGENGAGKSTIMKALAGVNRHYEGEIIWKGEPIKAESIVEQNERGISIIFQEMNLLPNLTVAENIFFGRHPTDSMGMVLWDKMNNDARELLDSIGTNIREDALIKDLTVGAMQMVEIAKALSFESDLVIMDEPTSALTNKETENLFEVIEKLKQRDVGIVYISHRLEEIDLLADRITILRDGKYILTEKKENLSREDLISNMVGREIDDFYPRVEVEVGDIALKVENLNQELNGLKDISFFARAGETTGFYGLMGAGRTELMRAIYGADHYDSGDVYIWGEKTNIKSCEDGKNKGIAFLTEDRKTQGLILDFSISENISITNIGLAA